MLIRPRNFSSNEETLASNDFQYGFNESSNLTQIRENVDSEFTNMVKILTHHEIDHIVFDDINDLGSPDAIFPNNWITFHEDGTVVLYPMMSSKRRNERRLDIVESLSNQGFLVSNTIDMSYLENKAEYLEGTGSLILDRVSKKAYACISSRTSSEAISVFAKNMNYQVIEFRSTTDIPIYHTNVMMSLGEDTALVCFDAIEEKEISNQLEMQLKDSGRTLIYVTIDQMNNFLGNALEVRNKKDEKYLLMSDTAKKSLTKEQERMIEDRLNLLSFPIPTIEKYGGGSVRCMLAEIFLGKTEQNDDQ
uniref:Uncharacterized protein conserved in bacteria containing a pentein-type domain n=1 Tax=uncultured gamma proteobacterium HF0130_22O14 TaxID=723567 RepID=E7C2V9_9GAMM|nr:uncharacterized protein conserved in bacteria containing a pentein-type domain [uncultured gamma proteobacterium HF0130_22O14]